MSREEQQQLREQSIAGLQTILVGFDTQSELGSAVGLQAPSASTMSGRHVLNLVNSLMPQPARFPMPAMFQVSNAVPSAMWPQYAASQPARPCHGKFSSIKFERYRVYPACDPDNSSYPWWEVSEKLDDGIRNLEGSYHLRTRRQNGTVALLIDSGAHDNLIGRAAAQQMCNELQSELHLRNMEEPLPVEGVGKSAQVADRVACIPMAVLYVFGKKTDVTYTAPIIQDSMLPPLLGNHTLRKMKVIVDCGSGKLILPGPGGVKGKMSRVFDLELTSRGHWVLPSQCRDQSGQEEIGT